MSTVVPLVYGNFLSQPSRCVLWALRIKDIPFTLVDVQPVKGENESTQFLAKFPAGVIPALEDGDLLITEANAILTYMAQTHHWDDWYPLHDTKQRARIDMWLHWHHSNMRAITKYCFRPCRKALHKADSTGIETSVAEYREILASFEAGRPEIDDALTVLNGVLSLRPFVVGDAVTLADLAFYCELDQVAVVGPALYDLQPFDAVSRWMERMSRLPHHDAVRQTLIRLAPGIRATAMRARASK